jgi:hypothetical protein
MKYNFTTWTVKCVFVAGGLFPTMDDNLNSMIPSILVVNHHPHSQSGEHGKGDEMENILGTSAKPCGHMGHRVEIPAQVGAQ